jgi:hypothetical protein
MACAAHRDPRAMRLRQITQKDCGIRAPPKIPPAGGGGAVAASYAISSALAASI